MERLLVKILYALQALFSKKDSKCPFCGEGNAQKAHKKQGLVDILKCGKCGLYWTNPVFRFPGFYNVLYRAEGITTDVDESELRNDIANNFTGSNKDFSKVLSWLKAKAPEAKKLLEFGSSWGYFLYQAGKQGFQAVGIEIAEDRAEMGRKRLGVDIRPSLDELIDKGEKFDIIFTAHTLEHIGYEISKIFPKFKKLLAPNGILVIEVPRLQTDKRNSAFGNIGAVHPLGFTKEFFTANLPREGFTAEVYGGYASPGRTEDSDVLVVLVRPAI